MSDSPSLANEKSLYAVRWLLAPLVLVMHVARILCGAVLMIVAPLLGAVLSVMAVALALTACFFEWFSAVPNFPFWPMLGGALACAIARLTLERVTAAVLRS